MLWFSNLYVIAITCKHWNTVFRLNIIQWNFTFILFLLFLILIVFISMLLYGIVHTVAKVGLMCRLLLGYYKNIWFDRHLYLRCIPNKNVEGNVGFPWCNFRYLDVRKLILLAIKQQEVKVIAILWQNSTTTTRITSAALRIIPKNFSRNTL